MDHITMENEKQKINDFILKANLEIEKITKKRDIAIELQRGKIFIRKNGNNFLGTFVTIDELPLEYVKPDEIVEYTDEFKRIESKWRLPCRYEYERYNASYKEIEAKIEHFTGNCDKYSYGGSHDVVLYRDNCNFELYFYHGKSPNYNAIKTAHERASINDVGCINQSNHRGPFRVVRTVERDTTNTNISYNKQKLDKIEWYNMPEEDKFKGYSLEETLEYIDKLNGNC